MMLKFIFASVMLWHCLSCMVAANDNLENLNQNLMDIKHDLLPKNVSHAQEHKSIDNEAKNVVQAENKIKTEEMTGNKIYKKKQNFNLSTISFKQKT